jgi:hypothetical protein
MSRVKPYRIEIVVRGTTLQEPLLERVLPDLLAVVTPDAGFYTVYGCNLERDLNRHERSILDGLVEEGDLLAYECRRRANDGVD